MIKPGAILTNEDLVKCIGSAGQNKMFDKYKKLTSSSKSALIKKLDSICEYKKIKIGKKQAYKILKVYESPKIIEDKRVNNSGVIVYENMCRSKDGGIYGLTTEEGLYIGSTKAFKNRHHQHIKSGLANNIKGEFNILWSDGIEDRELLYEIENIAIEIAIKEGIKLVNKKLPSVNYNNIFISNEDYDKVIELLIENNIDFKE